MPKLVVAGAQLSCSMGLAPAVLVVLPANKVVSTTPAANIMDSIPMTNIPTFGMCTTQSNPAVAAATAAALGTPTPAPCVPNTSGPWTPGAAKTMIANQPALNDSCTCMCSYGGSISITSPGQTTVDCN